MKYSLIGWTAGLLIIIPEHRLGVFSTSPALAQNTLTQERSPNPNEWLQRGDQQFRLSQFHDALESYQQALDGLESQPASNLLGMTLYKLAITSRILSQYEQAQTYIDRALQIAEQTSDRPLLARSLSESGVIAYSQSLYPEALSLYEQAIALSREIGDSQTEGETLDHMGVIYRRQGDYPQALTLHQQALALIEAVGNRTTQARILNNIGIIYDSQSEYDTALTYYRQALVLSRQTGNRLFESRILDSIGLTSVNQGNYAEALTYYQQALSIRQEIGDRFGESHTLSNLGGLYNNWGDYSQALTYYQQSLQIRQEIGDRFGEGIVLSNIGLLYWNQGNYDRAFEFLNHSLDIRREVGDRPGEADTFSNIGGVYYSQGQYSVALDFYQQALTIYQEIGDRAGQGYSLNSIGGTYYSLGQYEQAFAFYEQALTIRQAIGDRAGAGTTLSNIGLIFDVQGDYPQALDYYQQALTIRQAIGDRIGEANTLNNMGLIYDSLGHYNEALAVYEQTLRIRQEAGDRAGEGATLNNIALVNERLNQTTAALSTYQQAILIFREIGDRAGERLALSNMGNALAAEGNPALAILFYKQSVNLTEAIRQDLEGLPQDIQTAYAETVAPTYRQLADLLLQQDRVLEAQQVLDLLKVQELEDYLQDVRGNEQTAQGLDYWQPEQAILELYERAIAQGRELADLRAIPPGERSPEQQARLAELVADEQTLVLSFDDFLNQADVIAALDQLTYTTRRQTLDLTQLNALQNNLDNLQNAVLLYPLILEDRLELVLVTPYTPPIRRTVPVSRTELNEGITAFRNQLTNRVRNPIPEAQQLYQWLIQPIEQDLQEAGAETILYAPDGSLRYIPLAALHDGDEWLIQRFRINYITAASLTNFDTPPQPDLRVLAGAFTEGQFSFQVGTREFNFAGLPFAKLEVERIAAEIPQTTQLVDQDFSREAMVPQMDDYTIVHLATHAEFVPGSPEESFILFGNGDRVTLRDMATWTLRNVDLVVLSACKTAVGAELGNGEEILGFGYQIQRTGARAAIASLWAVDDGGTQVLMNAFYTALEQPNITKAEALRQAQIALITGTYPAVDVNNPSARLFNRPYYWAPFILIGNGL